MNKLRVIQWTTGKVGKLSLRAILDDPRLELAGAAGSGVLGLRDVGLPYAPAGIWLGNRSGASK